jgi:tRNA U55 pseudouridine synthase TruB
VCFQIESAHCDALLKLKNGEAKQSRDNTTTSSKSDGYMLNGEWIEMASDLKDLPEIDYNDPDVQKWREETQAEWKKKNPNLTHEELIKSVEENNTKSSRP